MRHLAIALVLVAACSGSTETDPAADTTSTTGSAGSSAGGNGSSTGGSSTGGSSSGGLAGSGGSGATGGGPAIEASCFDAPPAGAVEPPLPPAYSGGTCPTLVTGVNEIQSGGATRQFYLALPSDLGPEERLPVAFLWHWLGGDMFDFYEHGDVQTAVDHFRFAAVIPNEKGDLQFKWPIEVIASDGRIAEEVTFFDDMLACVVEQLAVNRSCVSSAGVSAGALWTPILAAARGDLLASIVSLSGGSGGFIKAWEGSPKKMPAMVLWGGEQDNCFGLMNFVQTSQNLEQGLTEDGHFLLECVHNCGHAPPPFEQPGAPTAFTPLWEFILAHPYWLAPGQSPFASGLPAAMPEWCGVGMGSATPRTGECLEESGC
jgi:predicted esterase